MNHSGVVLERLIVPKRLIMQDLMFVLVELTELAITIPTWDFGRYGLVENTFSSW